MQLHQHGESVDDPHVLLQGLHHPMLQGILVVLVDTCHLAHLAGYVMDIFHHDTEPEGREGESEEGREEVREGGRKRGREEREEGKRGKKGKGKREKREGGKARENGERDGKKKRDTHTFSLSFSLSSPSPLILSPVPRSTVCLISTALLLWLCSTLLGCHRVEG